MVHCSLPSKSATRSGNFEMISVNPLNSVEDFIVSQTVRPSFGSVGCDTGLADPKMGGGDSQAPASKNAREGFECFYS
jgi:hypothetical protein